MQTTLKQVVRRMSAIFSAMHRSQRRPVARAWLAGLVATIVSFSQIGVAYAANGSVIYTYDALGRISTASYDTNVFVSYSYDANGNRTSQTINVNTSALSWAATHTPCTSNCWGAGLW